MFVIGGKVQGGKVYGDWTTLAPGKTYQNRDLEVTTDFRTVLNEILYGHMKLHPSRKLFPGFEDEKQPGPLRLTRRVPARSAEVRSCSPRARVANLYVGFTAPWLARCTFPAGLEGNRLATVQRREESMNRVHLPSGAVHVVAGLVLALSLGGCYSRSARKKALEEASAAPAVPTTAGRSPFLGTRCGAGSFCVRGASPRGAVHDARPCVRGPSPAGRKDRLKGKARSTSLRYGRPGFAVYETESGRLWVFRDGSDDLREFLDAGEPAKRITRIGVGPDERSLMSSDGATLDAYLAATVYAYPGFFVETLDGRLWVFKEGSEALADYRQVGEPAKRLTRIAAGPDDLTLIGPDAETLDEYTVKKVFGRAGFATYLIDGRLWVFQSPSEELVQFATVGEPAKRVTRVGAGPRDLTLVGPDGETLDAYMAAYGS